MKKIVLFLTACFAFMLVAQAQLSEGQPRATTIKTGNRPQSGDWGLYIGPSFTEVVDLIKWARSVKQDEGIAVVRGLPLVNVKYYFSDNVEFRAGIQFYNVVNKYNGSYIVNDKNETAKNKYSNALFRLTPGLTYHFNTKNIVDVYMGGQLPFGFDIDKDINEAGGIKNNFTRNSFVIGIGALIGLQFFVADLPFSIGLEYGLSGLLKCGQKVKHEFTDAEGNTQVYYQTLEDYNNNVPGMTPTGILYSKLNSNTFEIGNDFRLTFTYYFNNKK